MLLLALGLSACGGSSTTSTSPSGGIPTASPTEAATATPALTATATPTPAPTPAAAACTGSDLNVLFGAESSAAGGQQGMTALLANDSGTACQLNGSLQAQLLTSTGGSPTTSLESPAPTGSAWLVPDRVALDAFWPQSGEATVTVSWHTGDVQPGVCSGAAPSVGEVSLSLPGGGSVTGSLADSFAELTMAPCNGVVQLGMITETGAPQPFATPTVAAEDASQEEFAGITYAGWPLANPIYTVSTGTNAAVVSYDGPDCAAFTYLWQDSAGWHVLDTGCTQASGYLPRLSQGGDYGSVFGPTSTGCADVYSSPSHSSTVVGCLAFGAYTGSAWVNNTRYTIDQGPTYTPETDPTSQQPEGTIWWHIQGQGWVTQDYLVDLAP